MSLRRVFLLSAAAIVSLAALIAIGAVLDGAFGDTEEKILATLATTFVAGSTVIAGLACLAHERSRVLGFGGVVLACGGFVLWTAQIWGGYHSDGYWKLIGLVTAWALALLIATTARLMTSSPTLLRSLYPATAGAAGGAALVASVLILRENGDGWQLLAVLLILALLGETLTPVLERFQAAGDRDVERVLGSVAGVEVLAVRGGSRASVQIGETIAQLAPGERIVVRPRA